MKRNQGLKKIRVNLVKLALNDQKKAAKKLHELAEGLGNTKTTGDTIYALSRIFGVSERTIFRDIIEN